MKGGVGAPVDDVSKIGLTGVFPDLPDAVRLYPTIAFQGINNSDVRKHFSNSSTTSDIPTWEFADSLSIVHGKHTIAIGADYRRWTQRRNLSGTIWVLGQINPTIPFSITGADAQLCPVGQVIQWQTSCSATITMPRHFQPGPFSPAGSPGNLNQYRFVYFAPYVQDDWKVTHRLTLNMGLRWDYRAVPYEQDDKMFWFDRGNPAGGCAMQTRIWDTMDNSGWVARSRLTGTDFTDTAAGNNPAAGI